MCTSPLSILKLRERERENANQSEMESPFLEFYVIGTTKDFFFLLYKGREYKKSKL